MAPEVTRRLIRETIMGPTMLCAGKVGMTLQKQKPFSPPKWRFFKGDFQPTVPGTAVPRSTPIHNNLACLTWHHLHEKPL